MQQLKTLYLSYRWVISISSKEAEDQFGTSSMLLCTVVVPHTRLAAGDLQAGVIKISCSNFTLLFSRPFTLLFLFIFNC